MQQGGHMQHIQLGVVPNISLASNKAMPSSCLHKRCMMHQMHTHTHTCVETSTVMEVSTRSWADFRRASRASSPRAACGRTSEKR